LGEGSRSRLTVYSRRMGRSGRRPRLALAVSVIVGVVAVVLIAVASRVGTQPRIEVSSPVSGDGTSTSTSEVIAANTTGVADTTTTMAQVDTSTIPASTSTSSVTHTSVAPTPTSEPTMSGAPVDGTYFGVEHFALFTGRCAFLDHHIVGTFSPADGTTWTLHQDYCGTLQGDLWSGVGTLSLTAPDGAMITGTVTETNIQVPSPGVPYTVDITAGTQRFSSASGTCRLDNHLRVIQFGLQDDFGSFTCNIAV
jgi:hypothetical protein